MRKYIYDCAIKKKQTKFSKKKVLTHYQTVNWNSPTLFLQYVMEFVFVPTGFCQPRLPKFLMNCSELDMTDK